MASLGDMLRAAREERGISLSEAERETKIRLKYLSAMEDDNPALMPGPTYARGFLRNYAAYLGLDPNEAVELFEEQSQPTRDKLKAARGHAPVRTAANPATEKISIQPLSAERIDTRVRYGSQYIALSLLAIPLIIVFYFVYNAYAGPRSQTPPIPQLTPRPATPTKLTAPTVLVQGPVTGAFNTPTVYVPASPSVVSGTLPITQTAGGVITSTAPITPTAPVAAAADITVRVDTTRDAWMSVLVDGVQRFSGTLPSGATREWKGRNTIQVRTGRADSVRVTINGADRGFMGAPGRNVVEKRWNKEGQETIIR